MPLFDLFKYKTIGDRNLTGAAPKFKRVNFPCYSTVLLNNLGHGTGAHCTTALADREAQALVHGHWRN